MDYPAAKAMIAGLKTYISGLEALGTSVDQYSIDLDAQSLAFEALYDESLSNVGESIAVIMWATGNVIDENIAAVGDANYTLLQALQLSPHFDPSDPDIFSSDITFTYTSSTKQVTVGGSHITLNNIAGTGTIANTVSVGTITTPTATSGKDFTVAFTNISAENTKAKAVIPTLSAHLVTTNSLDLTVDTEQDPGNSSLTIEFGSDTSPVTIENLTNNSDKASFEGSIFADILLRSGTAFNTTNGTDSSQVVLPKSITFDGMLSQGGVDTKVDLSLSMLNADAYTYVSMTPGLLAAADGSGQVADFVTFSTTDVTANYSTDSFSSGALLLKATQANPVQIREFDGVGYGSSSSSLNTVLEVDTNSDGIADVFYGTYSHYSLDTAECCSPIATSTFAAVAEAFIEGGLQSYFYNDGLGEWGLYGNYLSQNHDSNIYATISVDTTAVIAGLVATGSVSLPLDIHSAYIDSDIFGSDSTFDNFPQLTATAGLTLTGLLDTVDDSPLDPLEIRVTLDLTHYLDYQNNVKIGFSLGDNTDGNNTFTAKMNWGDLDDDNGQVKVRTSFQDNAGGRIEFKNIYMNDYSNGTTYGDVYYNNVQHGKLIIDYKNDGNAYVAWFDDDTTEELIYEGQQ